MEQVSTIKTYQQGERMVQKKLEAEVIQLEYMAENISKKYHAIKKEDAIEILKAFQKYIQSKLLIGESVFVKNFGKWGIYEKKQMKTKSWKGEERIKPKMIQPRFELARKLKAYINQK